MMAVKGYFMAPRLHGRKQEGTAKRGELYRGEGLRAPLLDAGSGDELAPKGYFAVYVGAEARRFVVPTSYLRQPAFRDLMESAAEEFGFTSAGGIRIPCREEDFQATVVELDAAVVAAGGQGRRGGGQIAQGLVVVASRRARRIAALEIMKMRKDCF
ncbi:unnamed protein product [Urochloa humidicola]